MSRSVLRLSQLLGHIQCEFVCEQPFGDITQTGLNDTSLSAHVNAYISIHFWIRVRLAICFVKSFMRLCLSKAIDLCHAAVILS